MKRSKVILGLKKPSEFSIEERKMIIEEWLNSGKTKREIWMLFLFIKARNYLNQLIVKKRVGLKNYSTFM